MGMIMAEVTKYLLNTKISHRAVVIFMLLCSAFTLVEGQVPETKTPLAGRVVDQNGAAVAGAKIRATSMTTGVVADTATNGDGAFLFELRAAEYKLTVTAEGFGQSTLSVDLRNADRSVDVIVLQISPATATVMVSDEGIYVAGDLRSATKTYVPLRDVPQSITVIKQEQIRDQSMSSIADVIKYVPGVSSHQGENNRDELIIRGNRSGADFFVNGVRDDVQSYRDPYNL